MAETVLLLDGAQRSALAIARSLGKRGVKVFVGDAGSTSLASRSRYAAGHIELPSSRMMAGEFVQEVTNAYHRLGADLVVPATDASMTLLMEPNRADPAVTAMRIAGSPYSAYHQVSDKALLVELASDLGVPTPRTITVQTLDELKSATASTGFPCVLKPARSKLRQGNGIVSTAVSIVNNPKERDESPALRWIDVMPILVQEFIPGSGAGVFALYGPNGPVTWFCHRRLREKPPSGGVSVLCESVPVDPLMGDYAERLLSAAGWFGPAMVEFRVDPAGKPWLMEINGRFWGSLQLAIDCGVDFPWLFYQLYLGEDVRGPEQYAVGRRMRWLLGDLDHLLLQLRGKGTAHSVGAKLKALGRFTNFFDSRTQFEVLRRDDMGPFRHELREWFKALR